MPHHRHTRGTRMRVHTDTCARIHTQRGEGPLDTELGTHVVHRVLAGSEVLLQPLHLGGTALQLLGGGEELGLDVLLRLRLRRQLDRGAGHTWGGLA